MNDFCVITCHFNPANWKSTRRNYQRFLHHVSWWDIPVFSAEIAYENQTFASESSWLKIRGTDLNMIWQKERLLNLLVEKLPPNFTKIAWIDADVIFVDNDWPTKVSKALDDYKLIQMWDHWHLAGPNGEIAQVLSSVGHLGKRYLAGETRSPGGAWAGHRDIFPLYDKHIVGGGDSMCFEAWMNIDYSMFVLEDLNLMKEHFIEWKQKAYQKVKGNITCMNFDMMHMYHGSRNDRQYIDRWKPLIQNEYDPANFVFVDNQGILSWTDLAPSNLKDAVKSYFINRLEDDYTKPFYIPTEKKMLEKKKEIKQKKYTPSPTPVPLPVSMQE